MANKPVLTKEQAEAIDYMLKQCCGNKDEVLRSLCCMGGPLCDVPITTLAAALVNGYEVEQTPEEKVREYYGRYDNSYTDVHYRAAIKTTLDLLGIKISGVNAE